VRPNLVDNDRLGEVQRFRSLNVALVESVAELADRRIDPSVSLCSRGAHKRCKCDQDFHVGFPIVVILPP